MSLSRKDRSGGGGGMVSNSDIDARIAPWARRGKDRPTEIVDTLPNAADAKADVIYVRRSDWKEWIKKSTVTGLSHRVAHPISGLDLEGVFDSDLASPNADDFYLNSDTNRFRFWNGSAWSNRTIAQLFGSNRIGVNIGSGTPAPVTTDTIDEVVAYLVANGYDDSQTYIFYDSATSYPTAVREITAVTQNHEWVEVSSSLKGNSYDDYADRTIVAIGDRDTASKLTIEHDTGQIYNIHIEQDSDLIHLVDVDTGTAVRISEGNSLWLGRVQSFTKDSGVWILKTDFFTRRSTFTVGNNIHIEFGAYPLSRTTYFFGNNQTVRHPATLSAANHNTEQITTTSSVKRWTGNADENIHGGVAYQFLNSNDIANADTAHKIDADNTAIQIDENGQFHFRIKMFGNQMSDADARLRLYKVMSGVDDVALLSLLPWHTRSDSSVTLVSEFFDEEKYVNVTSGDQFILFFDRYNNNMRILAGYLEVERVD